MILAVAVRHALPAAYGNRDEALTGGLTSYSASIFAELARQYYDTANATSVPAMAALLKLVPVSQITYGTAIHTFQPTKTSSCASLTCRPPIFRRLSTATPPV